MENNRISLVYFCTCNLALSKLTKASLKSSLCPLQQAGVKQKLEPKCVCHIIIRVLQGVNDLLYSLYMDMQLPSFQSLLPNHLLAFESALHSTSLPDGGQLDEGGVKGDRESECAQDLKRGAKRKPAFEYFSKTVPMVEQRCSRVFFLFATNVGKYKYLLLELTKPYLTFLASPALTLMEAPLPYSCQGTILPQPLTFVPF